MGKTRSKAKTTNKTEDPLARSSGTPEPANTQHSGLLSLIERLTPGRVVLGLCLLSLLAYANAIGGEFVFDDIEQIKLNRDIRSWDNLGRAFTTHVWAFRERSKFLRVPTPPPYYRPIFTVALTVEYKVLDLLPVGGLWFQGWHLVSLLLHILCSIGVYYVLLLMSGRNLIAALAAALFAVYPVHVESVSWISGMTDPLFAVFVLWSFYFYLRYRLGSKQKHFILSIVLFAFATFSKETSLSMVALVFVYEMIESRFREAAGTPKRSAGLISAARLAAPFAAIGVIYLISRYLVLGGLTWKTGHSYEGPFIHTLYTLPSVMWAYVSHLIWPVDLSVAYFTSFVTSAASPRFLLPAIPLTLAVSLLFFFRKRISREVWHALALLIIPLLPVLDLRQLSVEYLVFDRYLYLSVAGWTYLLALGIGRLVATERGRAGWRSAIASVVVVLMIVGLTVATAGENKNWADTYSLWSQAARIRPQFWAGHYNAGVALMELKRYDEALGWLQHAASLAPEEPSVFDALGRCYDGTGNSENAVANFKRAIAIDPTMFESRNNLGEIYFKAKNYPAAEKEFAAALSLRPQAVAPLFNLGLCYERQSRYPEAARQFELVIEAAPEDAEAHYQLGLVYGKTGRIPDANRALEQSLTLAKSQELSQRIEEALAVIRNGK